MRVLLCCLALGAAGPAAADTFRVLLGGDEIGSVAVEGTGEGEGRALSLRASFDDTPLGVADGTYSATSGPVQGEGGVVRQFLGESAFGDSRVVSVLHAGGQVLSVDIAPAEDRTALSDPAAVPAGVRDPAETLDHLVHAGGCPAPFLLYEGRRLVEIAVAEEPSEGGGTACAGTYRVLEGPGHLSPLGIREVALRLRYDGGALTEIVLRSGPFTLSVVR